MAFYTILRIRKVSYKRSSQYLSWYDEVLFLMNFQKQAFLILKLETDKNIFPVWNFMMLKGLSVRKESDSSV